MLLELDLPQIDPAIQDLHTATAFYTHDRVVDELLDLAEWPQCGGTLLESGAGDGAIVVRAVGRLALAPDDIEGLRARESKRGRFIQRRPPPCGDGSPLTSKRGDGRRAFRARRVMPSCARRTFSRLVHRIDDTERQLRIPHS